jgi:prolyl-tRNA editing enzyme YbaK/EbsC (Cys-tRNA(Pro) deacylase)
MAVVPASGQVDCTKMAWLARGRVFGLAHEDELRRLFPDEEPGAVTPFGRLPGIFLVLDRRLAERDSMVFRAGNHTTAIRMKVSDYRALMNPIVADIATPWSQLASFPASRLHSELAS